MLYEATIKQILEDFNIYPYAQNAANAGPDQGMTSVDVNNTFPSRMETVLVNKIRKKKKKKKQQPRSIK